MSPRYADDFKSGLRDGQTAVVAGAGHMLPYEQPEQVKHRVEDFVKSAKKRLAHGRARRA